jgi:2-hydroxy-6-oxonona-2,4-dienedioate hydrolase
MTFWEDLMTVPHELRFVDVDGVRTRVLHAGSGTPLILLHGISGHLETYIPVLEALSAEFDVHAIDMLAHGFTGKPGGDYPVSRLAAHVIGYLDAIGAEKAHILGLSQGGWTAAFLAAEHPERVERLTLVVNVGNPHMPIEELGALLAETTNKAVFSDDREDTRTRIGTVISDKTKLTDEMVDIRFRIYQQPGLRAAMPGILASTEPAVYRRDSLTPARLASITAETLIVWSEDDPSGANGGDYYRDNIADAKLVVFRDVGHWPPYERPDEFAKLVIPFLLEGLDTVQEETI